MRHQIVSDVTDTAAESQTSWLIYHWRRRDSSVTDISVDDIGAADSEHTTNCRHRCRPQNHTQISFSNKTTTTFFIMPE